MNICARVGCGLEYTKKTHNQRYCSNECCRIATNERIMQKYYEKRDQRLGKVRYCSECNVTKLSRYNDSRVCGGCQSKIESSRNRSVSEMLMNVEWAV